MSELDHLNETLADVIATYADRLDTRATLIMHDAMRLGAPLLRAHLPTGAWLIAADDNTWRVAGQALCAALDALELPWTRYDVPDAHEGAPPMCDDHAVALFRDALVSGQYAAGVAVGSGTINDIVKLASHQAGLPMACVATAPSMNGYTSAIAAVLSHGVKTTVSCTAPRVVIADVDVMAQAPQRMIASGLGDLISKPVSNADWMLSAHLNGSYHSAEAMRVIELGAAMLEGVAERLPVRDREATAGLVASLILSGLAMSVAGSSSPASGGEHLISHYIDMTGHAFGLPCDFHGCQVGVGTLTTALLYERLMAMSPSDIDVEARVAALAPWEDDAQALREHFTTLAEAVLPHAQAGYPTPQALRERLTRLRDTWDETLTLVGATLRTSAAIEQELLSAHAPVRYAQLGVGRERARDAIVRSKSIRNRYTILHLAWELGVLEAWSDEALTRLYI